MQHLAFQSDLHLRYRFCTKEALAHPAKMHLGLLLWIVEHLTQPGDTVCDPMAGIGSTALAALTQRNVILRELEPRWVAECHRTAARVIDAAGLFAGQIDIQQGDAMKPWNVQADCVVMSPPYACRAASNANTRVGTLPHRIRALESGSMGERWQKFLTQPSAGADGAIRFFYGDHPDQVGHLRGARYWQSMEAIYTNAYVALRPGGRMVLVIKDHIKAGQRVSIVDDTIALCVRLGFSLEDCFSRKLTTFSLWQRRRKERGEPIIEEEDVIVLRKAQP